MSPLTISTPPMESFFSPLSLLPSAPAVSLPILPTMSSALSAGCLYRSQTFTRELGSTNPEWNLAHSHPFQSLAFDAFAQALNTITPLHAMCIVACETTTQLQVLENDKFSLANQVSHLSSVNEQLLSELQTSGFHRCQSMCGKVFPDLDFQQIPYTEEEFADRLLVGWLSSSPNIVTSSPSPSPTM
ncbi:hypothetical protein ZOSMA_271G00140 [Zostera marina]|uniref:Uncharacterized protein n=1 Tax=Zostera marina TaxID=29655 RepID=A0A0K9PE35_ZOSMR|nr:hypothetical protein ZOSMA_271G00140 [Zostera marina]